MNLSPNGSNGSSKEPYKPNGTHGHSYEEPQLQDVKSVVEAEITDPETSDPNSTYHAFAKGKDLIDKSVASATRVLTEAKGTTGVDEILNSSKGKSPLPYDGFDPHNPRGDFQWYGPLKRQKKFGPHEDFGTIPEPGMTSEQIAWTYGPGHYQLRHSGVTGYTVHFNFSKTYVDFLRKNNPPAPGDVFDYDAVITGEDKKIIEPPKPLIDPGILELMKILKPDAASGASSKEIKNAWDEAYDKGVKSAKNEIDTLKTINADKDKIIADRDETIKELRQNIEDLRDELEDAKVKLAESGKSDNDDDPAPEQPKDRIDRMIDLGEKAIEVMGKHKSETTPQRQLPPPETKVVEKKVPVSASEIIKNAVINGFKQKILATEVAQNLLPVVAQMSMEKMMIQQFAVDQIVNYLVDNHLKGLVGDGMPQYLTDIVNHLKSKL